MAPPSLLLVVLPAGLTATGALRASIYVTPRLAATGTLADFPDLLDWPGLIKSKGLSLELACAHDLKTLAFPCISTGIFGYPVDAAAKIAVETVRRFDGNLDEVLFCCFQREDLAVYKSLLG